MDKNEPIRPPVDIDHNPAAEHDPAEREQAEHAAHQAVQRFIGHGATVKDLEALVSKQLDLAGVPAASVKITV